LRFLKTIKLKTIKVWKHKVPPTYSHALPINAQSGREWEPENACSLDGRRDDGLYVYCALFACICLYPSGILNRPASTALVETEVTSVVVSIIEPAAPLGAEPDLSSC
jgi:hypothetical protein